MEAKLAAVALRSLFVRNIFFGGRARRRVDLDRVIIRDELIGKHSILSEETDEIVASVLEIKRGFTYVSDARGDRHLRDMALRESGVLNSEKSLVKNQIRDI